MSNYEQNCYDEPIESEKYSISEAKIEKAPLDVAAIANASASALNGPNGAEVCKTIRHGIYAACVLTALWMIINYTHS